MAADDGGTSYFCAELVACGLKEGGLLEASSNPGAATPEMLYRIYKDQAAATANPYVLRDIGASTALSFDATVGASAAPISTSSARPQQRKKSAAAAAASAGALAIGGVTPQERAAERESLLHQRAHLFAPPSRAGAHAHLGAGRAARPGRLAAARALSGHHALRRVAGQRRPPLRPCHEDHRAAHHRAGSRRGRPTLNSSDMSRR